MKETYLRGDMYYTDLGDGIGSEQKGYRPVLIIQNNTGNKHSPTVIVAAISSKVGVKAKFYLPTTTLRPYAACKCPLSCCWSSFAPLTSGAWIPTSAD